MQDDVNPMFVNILENPIDTNTDAIVRKRIPENNKSKFKHNSDSRIDVKDVLLANKIINKDELAVALKRLDKLWDAEHLSSVRSELYQLVDLIFSFEGKSWDSYINEVDVASGDFMVEREDIIEQEGEA
ncbi:MAG: hypothetical protein JKX78_07720 [Alteromonadaceae bacterium]|nr:hypothetical protein [Alteromonadaceae bacterium]